MPKSIGYLISQKTITHELCQNLEVISTINQLPQSNCPFLVLNSDDETFNLSLLKQIRSMPNYQLIPIFYIGLKEDLSLNQVIDGPFNEEALNYSQRMQEKIVFLKNLATDNQDFEQLLINYAYVRDNFTLQCMLNYQDPAGFQYPLLHILNPGFSSADFWKILENMETRKLLIHHQMIDEIQSCSHCNSGLLNFKNCCPNCESSRINTQSFVHCFTCGNMGPISEFLQQNELTCNRCNTTLRHIGIDYDKPVEDKICQDCKFYFFEANVKALCMVCKKLSSPEKLEARKLYEYTLSPRGKSVAQGVEQPLIVELGQFLKLIDISIFKMIIQWQLILIRRHKEMQFSLASLRIDNEDELISNYGLLKTEKIIINFFERIRALLRDSDLIARDNSMILFFLPMTPTKGCLTILERIHSFSNTQLLENLSIKVQIGMMHSGELLEKNLDMDLLLNELYHKKIEDYE